MYVHTRTLLVGIRTYVVRVANKKESNGMDGWMDGRTDGRTDMIDFMNSNDNEFTIPC